MDDAAFDQLTQSCSRRAGLKGLIAGLVGILSFSAAEARVQVPPTCGGTGMQCASGDECCSGRCILKSDGTSRCARTTSNRKKKGMTKNADSGPPPNCTVCASGCAHRTIEQAILHAEPGAEVTIHQGTYRPTNIVDPQQDWAIKINKTMTVRACDENTEPVKIVPPANKLLFYIANSDESDNCQFEPIGVTLSGLILDSTGIAGTRAVKTLCNMTADGFKLIDVQVRKFDGQFAALTFYDGPVLIDQCELAQNSSDSYRGSLIHCFGTDLTIHDTAIHDNTSRSNNPEGGIVGHNGGYGELLTLTGTTEIFDNIVQATSSGGGVWVGQAQSPNWGMESTVKIHNNTGASAGGGIAAYTEPTAGSVVDNTTVYDNTATSCNDVYIASNLTCN